MITLWLQWSPPCPCPLFRSWTQCSLSWWWVQGIVHLLNTWVFLSAFKHPSINVLFFHIVPLRPHCLLLSQDELDLTGEHRAAMFSLPAEKKWNIYCSKKLVRNYEYTRKHISATYSRQLMYHDFIRLCVFMFFRRQRRTKEQPTGQSFILTSSGPWLLWVTQDILFSSCYYQFIHRKISDIFLLHHQFSS